MVVETHVLDEIEAQGGSIGPWVVPISGEGGVPLRHVLARVVAAEVERVERAWLAVAGRPQSAGEIQHAAATGKVAPTGARQRRRPVNLAAAQNAVLEAVERGVLLVFVDGRQVTELDAMVTVTADTRLRCVPLAPVRWED
jgi:hypothetical protein